MHSYEYREAQDDRQLGALCRYAYLMPAPDLLAFVSNRHTGQTGQHMLELPLADSALRVTAAAAASPAQIIAKLHCKLRSCSQGVFCTLDTNCALFNTHWAFCNVKASWTWLIVLICERMLSAEHVQCSLSCAR